MKNIIFSLLLLASTGATAGVIGFDDLPGNETEAIANGYKGFDWDALGAIRADAYPGSGDLSEILCAGPEFVVR